MEEKQLFLDTRNAASLLGVSRRTLEAWRLNGGGPPFCRLGQRRVVYNRDDLVNWAKAGRRTSTSDPGPEAAR